MKQWTDKINVVILLNSHALKSSVFWEHNVNLKIILRWIDITGDGRVRYPQEYGNVNPMISLWNIFLSMKLNMFCPNYYCGVTVAEEAVDAPQYTA